MEIAYLPEPPALTAETLGRYAALRETISQMLDPRCYSIEWLDKQLLNGAMQLWAGPEAVLVTQVRRYPAGAIDVHGMVAAGSLGGISEQRERVEAWARGNGADFISAASRAGWARVLERHGYAFHQIELRKEAFGWA